MPNQYLVNQFNPFRPQFTLLSEKQRQEIHSTSLQVLSQIGIKIPSGEVRSLLENAGCDVAEGNIVRIPEFLVERALKSVPSQIMLYTKDGKACLKLEGNNVYFGTGSDCHYFIDSATGERRKWTKKDIAVGSRICDALDHIDFVMSMGIASDVMTRTADVHHFEAMITNTVKPIVFTAYDVMTCEKIVEIASLVAGGKGILQQKPNVALFVETIPPLQITQDALNKATYMAKERLPIVYASGPLLGGTGPVTIAGCVAMANAEVLGGLVLTQLIREGTPFIYAVGIHPLDMRTTVPAYGATETSMAIAAQAEMAHHYGLPVWGYAGCSDAKVIDQQATTEATMSVIFSLLTGANLVHDVGYLESGVTTSYEMIALTNYIIEMSKRFMQGIPVNEEDLAFKIIYKVGPGGHFMIDDHTLKHFKETWYSDLCDRQKYDAWNKSGKLTLGDRIKQQVKDIIDNHKPDPLPSDVLSSIHEVVKKMDAQISG